MLARIMRSRTRLLLAALAVLAIACLAIFHRPILGVVHGHFGHGGPLPQAGGTVKDFEVADLTGKVWKLSELQKKTESGVVCLTFWCTFCHSCRQMDGHFQALAADYKDKATVIGIDASAADDANKVDAFVRARQFSVPVFMDKGGKVADLFGVKVTTTTIVIDKAGVIRYRGQFGSDASPYARFRPFSRERKSPSRQPRPRADLSFAGSPRRGLLKARAAFRLSEGRPSSLRGRFPSP